jgi:hypothetical protein
VKDSEFKGMTRLAAASEVVTLSGVGFWIFYGDPNFALVPVISLQVAVPSLSIGAIVGFLIFLVHAAESPSKPPMPRLTALGALVGLLLLYAAAYGIVGLHDVNCGPKEKPRIVHDGFICLYFAVVTWTILGLEISCPGHGLDVLSSL